MKSLKTTTTHITFLGLALTILTACGPGKKPVAKGYDEVKILCSGTEYRTKDGTLRANASGSSRDMEISREKAMTNARNRLSEQMEILISNLTDYYKKETDYLENSSMEKRFEDLVREVSKNNLRGAYPICEKTTRNKEGSFISYVAVELGGEEFLQQTANRLSKEEELKVDYDYEKFRDVYDKAIKEME